MLVCIGLVILLAGCRRHGEPPSLDGTVNGHTGQIQIEPEAQPPETPQEDQRSDRQGSIDWTANWLMTTSHGLLALSYIEHINDNYYERLPFSYREMETAMWIMEELYDMGYDLDDVKLQTFHRSDVEQWLYSPWEYLMWGMFEIDDFLRMYSQNVILTVPGQSERTIIVGAHYDSMIWPGGNDNASGTALLLESAKNMLEQENYYTIEYVFFGAEELGFLGASYYYESMTDQQRDNIVMMINADILLSGEFLIYGAGYVHSYDVIENEISQQVHAISQDLFQTHGIDITSHPEALGWGSDHLVFLEKNHTVIFLLGVHLIPEQEPDQDQPIFGSYGDKYITLRSWHSPEDCIHFINETWPGVAETNMWSFSLFLEAILHKTGDGSVS